MKVGFIGVGTMGSGMALNVRKARHDVAVHDVRQAAAGPHLAAGCVWANSPREAAEGADVVLTSVPGPKEVRAIAAEILPVMRKGAAWFDLSTVSPALARELAAEFAARGVAMLDCPVSGGPAGARSGRLALWVGGDKAAFDRYRPVLDAIGDQVLYVGPAGAATVAKLAHNMTGFAISAILAEIMTMGVKAGVESLALFAAIRQGAYGRKPLFDRLADQFLIQKWEPAAFALELAYKDAVLATEVGREYKVPMKIANAVLSEMTEAMNREGWPGQDTRVFMMLQEERAGLSIKLPEEEVREVLKRG